MNNVTKKRVGIFILLASALFFGQGLFASGTTEMGNGEIVKNNYDNAGFDKVNIEGIKDFQITMADDFSFSIKADGNIMEKIEVVQDGTELSIVLPDAYRYEPGTLAAEISLPSLEVLNIKAKSHGVLNQFACPDEVAISVTDGSSLTFDSFSADSASVEVSVNSVLTGSVNIAALDMKIYSSSLELSGVADIFRCFADAGTITMEDLAINTLLLDFHNETTGVCTLTEADSVDVRAYTNVKLFDESELTLSVPGDVDDYVEADSDLI